MHFQSQDKQTIYHPEQIPGRKSSLAYYSPTAVDCGSMSFMQKGFPNTTQLETVHRKKSLELSAHAFPLCGQIGNEHEQDNYDIPLSFHRPKLTNDQKSSMQNQVISYILDAELNQLHSYPSLTYFICQKMNYMEYQFKLVMGLPWSYIIISFKYVLHLYYFFFPIP